ncbi:MAG: hypothetical protein LBN92_00905 [Treponema sp.]|nr:hypothetical protein [Treponema sp.]
MRTQPAKTRPSASRPVFDAGSISKEEHDTAKNEIQQLIGKLNGIIRARNYDAWVSYLTEDYFNLISSPEFLEEVSNSERFKNQERKLASARDYFIYVVVPSRANDRVDDIQHTSPTTVIAYTDNARGERLRLYNLEKQPDGWKILQP